MTRTMFLAATACLTLLASWTGLRADDKVEAKGKDVDFQKYDGYFEKNNSGLTGDSSYLVFTDQKGYDAVFGVGRVIGKQHFLAANAFDSSLVIAAVKRGKAITEYKVEKVTNDDGALYVQYTATVKDAGGTATFASPLIVSVDKGKYTSVVFIENGKKAAAVDVGK
jgi:hypothetical protein